MISSSWKKTLFGVIAAGVMVAGIAVAEETAPAQAPADKQAPAKAAIELPQAAKDAIAKEFPESTVTRVKGGAQKEGPKVYFVNLALADKQSGSVTVTDDGTIQKTTAMVKAPDAIKATLDAEGQGAQLRNVQKLEVRVDEKMQPLPKPQITYTAKFTKQEGDMFKTGTITVDPDGKVVTPMKWTEPAPKKSADKPADKPAEKTEPAK